MEEIKVLSKAEAVEMHGTPAQIAHFEKYGKFVNKNMENALIKTLEQNYDSVERIKIGRAFHYQVGKKLNEVKERVDNRTTNGDWSTPYTKNMDIIVVSILERKKETSVDQTLTDWLLDFELISPQAHDLLKSRFSEDIKSKHLLDLKQKELILTGEERLMQDYIHHVERLQGELASTLKRMDKAGIIEFYKVFWGWNGTEKVLLSPATNAKAVALKKRLMEEHGITNAWHIEAYSFSKKVIQFNEEYRKELKLIEDEKGNVLGLKNTFMTHAVILKGTKKATIKYLEKYAKDAIEQYKIDSVKFVESNKTDYLENKLDKVVERCEKKAEKVLSTPVYNEDLHELGGKKAKPKLSDFPFEQEEYYSLFFEGRYVQKIAELEKYYNYKF